MPTNPKIRDSRACREMAEEWARVMWGIEDVAPRIGIYPALLYRTASILSDLHAPGPVGVAVRAMWVEWLWPGENRVSDDPAALDRAVEEALGEEG